MFTAADHVLARITKECGKRYALKISFFGKTTKFLYLQISTMIVYINEKVIMILNITDHDYFERSHKRKSENMVKLHFFLTNAVFKNT